MKNEQFISEKKVNIDEELTKRFFENRINKNLPHRYNYVNYQDSNPELALKRDNYEKKKIMEHLTIFESDKILDIGCGVGRWADEIAPRLGEGGLYVGIDYCEDFIKIANEHFKGDIHVNFLSGDFQNVYKIINKEFDGIKFDLIIINGVMMYINDDDLPECLSSARKLLNADGHIYIKESVGLDKRLTLSDFYSKELNDSYNAIYRSIEEYEKLFDKIFYNHKLTVTDYTFESDMANRKETASYFWIFQNDNMETK